MRGGIGGFGLEGLRGGPAGSSPCVHVCSSWGRWDLGAQMIPSTMRPSQRWLPLLQPLHISPGDSTLSSLLFCPLAPWLLTITRARASVCVWPSLTPPHIPSSLHPFLCCSLSFPTPFPRSSLRSRPRPRSPGSSSQALQPPRDRRARRGVTPGPRRGPCPGEGASEPAPAGAPRGPPATRYARAGRRAARRGLQRTPGPPAPPAGAPTHCQG